MKSPKEEQRLISHPIKCALERLNMLRYLAFAALILSALTPCASAQALPDEDQTDSAGIGAGVTSRIVDRGAGYRVIENTVVNIDPASGERQETRSRFTELADGMHFWNGTEWQESRDLIELASDGIHAVAKYGPAKVIFNPSLGEPGAIDLTSSSGKRFQFSPLGLYYFDKSTEKIVALAAVQAGDAKLFAPNQLVYEDAFDNLRADVLYVYAKNGFEQNVVLLERPSSPEQLGLNGDTTYLQVWTEFFNPPEPTKREAVLPLLTQKDGESIQTVTDEILDFGDVVFPVGKAFSIGSSPLDERATIDPHPLREGEAPVAKQWIKTKGRTFLIESVNYQDIEPHLRKLDVAANAPLQKESTSEFPSSLNSIFPSSTIRAVAEEQEPTPLFPKPGQEPAFSRPIQVAMSSYEQAGVVLDFYTYTGPTTYAAFPFLANQTYLIVGGVALTTGTANFQAGCVIKMGQGYLTVYNPPTFPSPGSAMPTFTSKDDDTVGEMITGLYASTHVPSSTGNTLLWLYYLGSSATINNARFRYGSPAIEVDGGSIGHTVANCFIERSQTGVDNRASGTVTLSNVRKCLVTNEKTGSGPSSGTMTADCIGIENAWPGDSTWKLDSGSTPARPGWPTFPVNANSPLTGRQPPEIQGFASSNSVNLGQSIKLYVNVQSPATDSSFKLQVYRVGWYAGTGGRKMTWYDTGTSTSVTEKNLSSRTQPLIYPDSNGMVDCLAGGTPWTSDYTVTVPSYWLSGVYLVKLTTSASLKASYIIFVVREDTRASDLYFQCSTATWQAYNPWGGNCLYGAATACASDGRINDPLVSPLGTRVSFNRPYTESPCVDSGNWYANGAGEFFGLVNVFGGPAWECNALRWIEMRGHDVTYCTSVDTHQGSLLNKSVKGFISLGHDEYWSSGMRSNVEAARDRSPARVNLAFLGANTCYWQIHFLDPSFRSFSCAKENNVDLWRGPTGSGNHESGMMGIEYMFNTVYPDEDITIQAGQTHWVFTYSAAFNASQTTTLPKLLGSEVDGIYTSAPGCQKYPLPTLRLGTTILASSSFNCTSGRIGDAYMSIYTAGSGSYVFATGSNNWPWGLDSFGNSLYHASYVNSTAQQIMENVLRQFAGKTLVAVP